jgi:hypothetical protein
MKMDCESQFDGYKCQLPRKHSGNHRHFGTDDEPMWVGWSDQGVEAVETEQKVSAALISH